MSADINELIPEGPDSWVDDGSDPKYDRYIVAVFLEDRAYGGPEEGGWYYDYGEHVRTIKIFRDEDKAYAYSRRMNRLLDIFCNRGRPSTGSVLSQGRFYASVWGDRVPKSFPDRKPYYE